MSATLDSDLFARYFGGCPVLAAGGRTFPVEHHFLEARARRVVSKPHPHS
jgi:HrpA-like RNA helicase